MIWYVMTAAAVLGLFWSLFMKALPLHTEMDEKWGLEEEELTGAAPHSDSAPRRQVVTADSSTSRASDIEMRVKTGDEGFEMDSGTLPSV